jgi:hypothetical protein
MNKKLIFIKDREIECWTSLLEFIKLFGEGSVEVQCKRAEWYVYHELIKVFTKK